MDTPPGDDAPDIGRLFRIMAQLRGPDGCPWDREQTHDSLKPYLIEETYEVLEAIDAGRPAGLCEELGDLLLQIVFHAQLAAETGQFGLQDVIVSISDKMVRRHPHVFGGEVAATASEVRDRWEEIKRDEGRAVFEGLPSGLPALMLAQRSGEKAAGLGFDWRPPAAVRQVIAKVREELDEIERELDDGAPGRRFEELGDVLFAVTNVARHLSISAEEALRAATVRFQRRFLATLQVADEAGCDLTECSDEELEAVWQRAKRLADPK